MTGPILKTAIRWSHHPVSISECTQTHLAGKIPLLLVTWYIHKGVLCNVCNYSLWF